MCHGLGKVIRPWVGVWASLQSLKLPVMPLLVRAWDVIIELVSAALRAPPPADCWPHRPSGQSTAGRSPRTDHRRRVAERDDSRRWGRRANPPFGAGLGSRQVNSLATQN